MRFLNKYKLSTRRTSVIAKTPLRVLFFKRSKWLKLKPLFIRCFKPKWKLKKRFKRSIARINTKSKLKARVQLIKKGLSAKTNSAEDKLKLESSQLKAEKKLKRFIPLLIRSRFLYKKKSSELRFHFCSKFRFRKKAFNLRIHRKYRLWRNASKLRICWKVRFKIRKLFKKAFLELKKKKGFGKRIRRKKISQTHIFNTSKVGVSGARQPPRMKKKYFEQLNQKRRFYSYFDNSITYPESSYKSRETFVGDTLIRPLFRIDILLWYLKYYCSTYEAKQNINNKKIMVNDKSVKPTYYVKEGDIISLSFTSNYEQKNTHFNIKKKFLKNKNFLSFLEYDKYTNTIIILKGIPFLTYEDYNLFVTEASQLKKILYK